MLFYVLLGVDGGGSCQCSATAEQLESLGEKKVISKMTKAKGNIKEKLRFCCLWSTGCDYFFDNYCHRARIKIGFRCHSYSITATVSRLEMSQFFESQKKSKKSWTDIVMMVLCSVSVKKRIKHFI